MVDLLSSQQLEDYAARLSADVAEQLYNSIKHADPSTKKKLEEMIENDLPKIVVGSFQKSPSLRTPKGMEYLQQNYNKMVDNYTNMILGKIGPID